MDVIIKQKDCEVIAEISGEIDNFAAEKLQVEMAKIVKLRPKSVILNLKEVPVMGSSGIGKILYLYKELNKNNATFAIRGMHANLLEIFKSLKLEKLFSIKKD
ncbi:MAG: STAS domain-containing protein [Syntrophaceae bacterium]